MRASGVSKCEAQSQNPNLNPDLLSKYDIKAWANVPREVILHKIASRICFEEKVYYALILLSWCGPHMSEACVVKNADGHVVRRADGSPVPARPKDVRQVLGLAPVARGNVCRALSALERKGSVRIDSAGIMYPVVTPGLGAPPEDISTDNFSMLGVVVSTDNLPEDSVARQAALTRLSVLKTDYLRELKGFRSHHRQLLKQALSELGIIIRKKRKKVRKKTEKKEEVGGLVGPSADSSGPTDTPTPSSEGPQATAPEFQPIRNDPTPEFTAELKTYLTSFTRGGRLPTGR